MYEETNQWAAYFAEQSKKNAEARKNALKKAQETRDYKMNKPKVVMALEAAKMANGVRESYDDRTANGLTRFIIDFLQFYGFYAARINIGGINIGGDKYRTSGSTKGVADVISCINGRFVQFEVKAGKDRPREAQLEQQRLTTAAGGFYFFTHNATEFVEQVKQVINHNNV